MNADQDRAKSIFLNAAELASPPERQAYIAAQCGDNEALRHEVADLLKHCAQASEFLESPAAKLVATIDEPVREGPGAVIGPYKLLEQIGEGGFGVVFVAEQQHPVRRKVALKVIKPGMDTRQVIARFEAERQALALMDHPNIARVLEAGETSSGRPYFVMELVRGPAMTEYCDQHNLPVRERLELFIDVCQAVQHAHQKGIIHRDIKPSNVLVTLHDGKPVVKVIDFGIAKAMGQQLTEKTLFTNFAQMIGTPLYMSPEQAEMTGLDVDTRSDIYSLGVLLYELLTGTTPFDKERLKQAGFDEIRRIIREEEPPKPSTRMSTVCHAAPTASTHRQSDPRKLSRLYRGELDWIVMKALEKDRNRRYETASAFAADVRRYLNDDPVQARPASAMYRFRKFARRNKTALGMASFVLVTVMALTGSAVWMGLQKAARRAETNRAVTTAVTQTETLLAEGDKQTDHPERWQTTAQLAEKAVERADDLAATGEATQELVQRVREARAAVNAAVGDSRLLVQLDRIHLEKAAAGKGTGFDATRTAALYKQALQDYGVDLAMPAETAERVRSSRLRETLLDALEDWWGATDNGAEREQMKKLLDAAWPAPNAFRQRWREAFARRDVAGLLQLAGSPQAQSQSPVAAVKMALALVSVNERSAAERLLRSWQESYPGDFWLNHDLGMLLLHQQPEEAVRYLTAALALRPDSPPVHNNLGVALKAKGDGEGAIREFRAALRIEPNLAMAHFNLGNALFAQKDLEGAIGEFQATLDIDPKYPRARKRLGEALFEKKDLEGAIDAFREATRVAPQDADARVSLGFALHANGDREGAIREYRVALGIDPKNSKTHYNLGCVLDEMKDGEGAILAYREAIRMDPKDARAHSNLGKVLTDNKDFKGAIDEYRSALAIDNKDATAHIGLGNALFAKNDLEGAIGAFSDGIVVYPQSAEAHNGLGFALFTKGDLDGAIKELRIAVAIDDKSETYQLNLGTALYGKNDFEGAKRAFQSAVRLAPGDSRGHSNLGNVLAAMNDLEGAVHEFQEALALDPNIAEARCLLGRALQRQGRFAEATRELKTGHERGSRRTHWNIPSGAWLREAQRLVELDAKLPKVLKREVEPVNAVERAQLAWLCQQPYKQLPAAAARLYEEAFAADPKLADDLRAQFRYNAGCAAALAGCGQGKDTSELDDAERARLRKKALDWLRDDLTQWTKQMENGPPPFWIALQNTLEHWGGDADLAGVRGETALGKLPEGERHEWQKLWADVEKTLAKAREKNNQKEKSEKKR
jgi:tetratricopeptide (TPR) repeat protein/serine/threonine protein kinase